MSIVRFFLQYEFLSCYRERNKSLVFEIHLPAEVAVYLWFYLCFFSIRNFIIHYKSIKSICSCLIYLDTYTMLSLSGAYNYKTAGFKYCIQLMNELKGHCFPVLISFYHLFIYLFIKLSVAVFVCLFLCLFSHVTPVASQPRVIVFIWTAAAAVGVSDVTNPWQRVNSSCQVVRFSAQIRSLTSHEPKTRMVKCDTCLGSTGEKKLS